MKNVLKLSLAVLAAVTLAACGGGGDADVADGYVGSWKSVCYSTTTSTGSTVYTKRIRTLSKVNATELAGSTILDNVFSDAGCANNTGAWSTNSPSNTKYVLGAKATFLGANTDSYVATFADGTSLPGYMVVDGVRLHMADGANVATATGWGKYSPYTKQ